MPKIMSKDTSRLKSGSGKDEAPAAPMPEQNLLAGLFRNKRLVILLAVLIVLILAITWPSRFSDAVKSGIFDRSLEKLDTCKGETDLAAKNNCYRDLAFSVNKTYFCNKVFNSSKITESCIAKLAVEANSKTGCEQIRDAKARGFCLNELAINKAELPLCANIDDDFWKNNCYSQLALLLKKPDACAKVEGSLQTADCYLAVAQNISSGATCAYIPDDLKKDECYLAVGSANGDKLLCEEIQDLGKKWTCYHRVAKLTGDTSLCNKIPSNLNQNCFDAVKKGIRE